MSITVLNPGLLTTVQDLGRIGYQQFGVSWPALWIPALPGSPISWRATPRGRRSWSVP